jgi:hypothetical protein
MISMAAAPNPGPAAATFSLKLQAFQTVTNNKKTSIPQAAG